MDTELYKFTDQTESMLKQFEKACEENITPENKWNKHFNNKNLLRKCKEEKTNPFPYSLLRKNLSYKDFIKTTQNAPKKTILEIPEDVIEKKNDNMDMEIPQEDNSTLNITSFDNLNISDENTDLKFDIKHIINSIASENTLEPYSIGKLIEKCLTDKEIFESILMNVSDTAIEHLCTSIFNYAPVNLHFVELFFGNFMIKALQMKNSRSIDNCVLASFRYSNEYFSKCFLTKWLSDTKINVDTFKTFVTLLTDVERCYILNEVIKNEFEENNFNRHLSVMHVLYESCDVNENVQGNMVRLLSSNASSTRDITYGKLLLIVIRNTKPSWSGIIETLNNLVDVNDSVLKKTCQNALSKLL